ncbi:hypothetical protein SKAU_G00209920 [Synaphobranchus kaupii]|uniref:Uncharacterized protein n=1 Tax=Synaphobranchus kaupii TaxID=118154 RepID=A0A9Q1F8T8_SYNKA|nr:hypothetical protein SKAU_G00209920 [Synaphobranchus kaupii]
MVLEIEGLAQKGKYIKGRPGRSQAEAEYEPDESGTNRNRRGGPRWNSGHVRLRSGTDSNGRGGPQSGNGNKPRDRHTAWGQKALRGAGCLGGTGEPGKVRGARAGWIQEVRAGTGGLGTTSLSWSRQGVGRRYDCRQDWGSRGKNPRGQGKQTEHDRKPNGGKDETKCTHFISKA